MKELSYLIKDIKDKNLNFLYNFLNDLNYKKISIESKMEDVLDYLGIENDFILIETDKECNKFKCTYKTEDDLDENKWLILKRKVLKNVAKKGNLQYVEDSCVLPIFCEQKIYFLVFNSFNNKDMEKYAVLLVCMFSILNALDINHILSTYTMYDATTETFNFNQFQKNLSTEIAKIDRLNMGMDLVSTTVKSDGKKKQNLVFSTIIFDVEGLDEINSQYGFGYGDLVLKHIASCIKNRIRATDECYRLKDDEFAVIANYAEKDVARDYIVKRILKEINSNKIKLDKKEFQPKVNVAILEYKKGTNKNDYMNELYEALAASKDNGGIEAR